MSDRPDRDILTGEYAARCADCGLPCESGADRFCPDCQARHHAAHCDQAFGHDGPCHLAPWQRS